MQKKSAVNSASVSTRALVVLFVSAAACLIVTRTLPAFLRSESPANLSQRTLIFAERVAYQRAIEGVYWRHRIWPKERTDPKPSLDAVMSQAQLEKKVTDYLRKSQALEDYWRRPITAAQLQAEMDRMAKHTRQPDVLRELFVALGNDPFVIAECLARPVLSERLKLATVEWRKAGLDPRNAGGEKQMPKLTAAANAKYVLPTVSDGPNGCTDDTWTVTSITNAPDVRWHHTAVWTGNEMIVWGGINNSGSLNTGGSYNPSTDSWTTTSTTNAPARRGIHTAVWTGSEMIVWGGRASSSLLNTGGRYNPRTDSWTATSTTNAPDARYYHTAVWTGNKMIVWGGTNFSTSFNTGGTYDPRRDSWTPTSTTNAPDARHAHTAVWTGSEMIVWGGDSASDVENSGGRYNPNSNSWTAMTTANAPDARLDHTVVWTGSEMIVWGGDDDSSTFNTGGRYNPITDTWRPTSMTNVPNARTYQSAVWTGSEMIIWGGRGGDSFWSTGARYNPLIDSWTATGFTNAPSARYHQTVVWTGSEMIIWGGYGRSNSSFFTNTGGRYCAQSPNPNAMKNFVKFALSNFTLTLLVVGLVALGIALIRARRGRRSHP
jgi:N-acetylneuraminic acid mutarotase